jgi:hypothetical protein
MSWMCLQLKLYAVHDAMSSGWQVPELASNIVSLRAAVCSLVMAQACTPNS